MKRILVLLLLVPSISFATDNGPIEVTGDTIGLWYFNGSSIGSSAGVDEATAGNDFSVISTNVPAYGGSGYGLAVHSCASDEAISLTVTAVKLETDAGNSEYSGSSTGEFSVEFIYRQQNGAVNQFYFSTGNPSAPTLDGWYFANRTDLPVGRNGANFFGFFDDSGSLGYFSAVVSTDVFGGAADNGDWLYAFMKYDVANTGSNNLLRLAMGNLTDYADSNMGDLFWPNVYDGVNTVGIDAPTTNHELKIGFLDHAVDATDTVIADYSVLHIMDAAQSDAWAESRFDDLANSANWCSSGRSRFIIQ